MAQLGTNQVYTQNLKLDEKSSYLMTFAFQFGRYIYTRVTFRASYMGDMFQRKIEEMFKELPNVFGAVDDILIVDYN